MCGITGMVLPPHRSVDERLLLRMCDTIAHRGPDDSGVFVAGHVGLGMRRLSIIDLASGKQPIHNEDSTVWVVFNGEIYNYRSLRARLEAAGHRFYTQSDTETIVHAYEEYGDDFVVQLEGMFGLALFDTVKQRVLIARDRIGEKQLFYAEHNGALTFGSEIKCLLVDGGLPRELDPIAVDEYFRYLYVPAPRTMYRAIRELPPGTLLTIERGAPAALRQYWSLPRPQFTMTDEAAAVEAVRAQLAESVRSRMVSDVPVGALLSGGVDSSAVVANMVDATDGRVRTYTIGYGEEGRVYDERSAAREIAAHFGTEHHEFSITPDIVELIPKLLRSFDQPFADSSAVANYYVFRETARHVKVVLSGLGGDEVFGGYERHLAVRLHAAMHWLPEWLRSGGLARLAAYLPEPRDGARWADRAKRFLNAAGLPPGAAYARYMTAFDAEQRRQLYSSELRATLDRQLSDDGRLVELFADYDCGDELAAAMLVDTLTYLPGDLMTLTDRMSMAHSIEARAPLVDHRLIELAARIPSAIRIRGAEKKRVLREAIRPRVPPSVLKSPKRGFTIPLTVWFRDTLQPYLRDALAPAKVARTGLFDPSAVTRLIDEHVTRRHNHHARLWALLMFVAWHEEYAAA
jgi:asparagine synthase (glutamine-hydrolysing)